MYYLGYYFIGDPRLFFECFGSYYSLRQYPRRRKYKMHGRNSNLFISVGRALYMIFDE
jgi:hypothetical protein